MLFWGVIMDENMDNSDETRLGLGCTFSCFWSLHMGGTVFCDFGAPTLIFGWRWQGEIGITLAHTIPHHFLSLARQIESHHLSWLLDNAAAVMYLAPPLRQLEAAIWSALSSEILASL